MGGGWGGELTLMSTLCDKHFMLFHQSLQQPQWIVIAPLQRRKQRLIKLQWLSKLGQAAGKVMALDLQLMLFDSKDRGFDAIQCRFPVCSPHLNLPFLSKPLPPQWKHVPLSSLTSRPVSQGGLLSPSDRSTAGTCGPHSWTPPGPASSGVSGIRV